VPSDEPDSIPEAPGNGPAWETAASFAVIFARREVDGGWDRRLEAEQTEVEPEPEPRQWPGWDPGPLCDWMLAQLAPAPAGPSPAAPARAAPARGARAELRIDSATITDAAGDTDLISHGNPGAVPGDLRHPVRLRFTVAGGRSGQQLRAAVWFRRRAAPGWSPNEPVLVTPSGQAEFDLSPVPPGGHEIRLLAWATDPGATLAAVTLPELVFAARV
jgi:hypothetical protein